MLKRVCIVGAGVAGLCCARVLVEAGVTVTILDAADAVGGRVRTDVVDGFLLDRGFQVLLTAYPELKRFIDLSSLDLRPFEPGAMMFHPLHPEIHSLHDVIRSPAMLMSTLRSPAATLRDLMRTAKLKATLLATDTDEILIAKQMTTLERLRSTGFSSRVIESFYQPFFGGVFLDDTLSASSRAFDFTFKMMASGDTAVPARGMQRIPEQIAARLPDDAIRLRTRVTTIANRLVVTDTGESILADAVVIATDADSAAHLAPEYIKPDTRWTGTTCLAFAADGGRYAKSLFKRPVMLLVAGEGPINTIVSMSDVSPAYSASGQNLVYVNLIGTDHGDDASIESAVRKQLETVLGPDVAGWRLLRLQRVAHALPDQSIAAMSDVRKRVRLRKGLYVCGDHVDLASLNGAMSAGRRAAESILSDFAV